MSPSALIDKRELLGSRSTCISVGAYRSVGSTYKARTVGCRRDTGAESSRCAQETHSGLVVPKSALRIVTEIALGFSTIACGGIHVVEKRASRPNGLGPATATATAPAPARRRRPDSLTAYIMTGAKGQHRSRDDRAERSMLLGNPG